MCVGAQSAPLAAVCSARPWLFSCFSTLSLSSKRPPNAVSTAVNPTVSYSTHRVMGAYCQDLPQRSSLPFQPRLVVSALVPLLFCRCDNCDLSVCQSKVLPLPHDAHVKSQPVGGTMTSFSNPGLPSHRGNCCGHLLEFLSRKLCTCLTIVVVVRHIPSLALWIIQSTACLGARCVSVFMVDLSFSMVAP